MSDFIFINLLSTIFFPALTDIVSANINLRDLQGVYQFIENEIPDNIEPNGTKEINSISQISFDIKNLSYGKLALIQDGSFIAKPGDIIISTECLDAENLLS